MTAFKTVFNRKSKLSKDNKGIVELRIRLNSGVRKFINIAKIKPELWSEKKGEINKKHPNAGILNKRVDDLVYKIERLEVELKEKDKQLTIKDINELIEGKQSEDIANFWTELCKEEAYTTPKHEYTALNYLKKFKPRGVPFSDLSLDFIIEYDFFLKSYISEETREKLAPSTVWNQHKFFKKMLKVAIRRGKFEYNGTFDYFGFKKPRLDSRKEFLTKDEIRKIEEIQFIEETQQGLIDSKNIFLFGIYTGLRFSDIISLKPKDIDFDKEFGYSISRMMNKTERQVVLPLRFLFDGKAETLLIKYINNTPSGEYNIFSKVTNKTINLHLKAIQAAAGIKKRLHFHISRHTFLSIISFEIDNENLLRDLAGHSDIKMTQNYVHRSPAMVIKQMKSVSEAKQIIEFAKKNEISVGDVLFYAKKGMKNDKAT